MTAELARTVKHSRVIGVDIDPDMIAYARQHHKPMDSVDYWTEDMGGEWEALSAGVRALEGRVSLVVSNMAVHWIADKSQLFSVLWRLLAAGGGSMVAEWVLAPDVNPLV